MSGGRRSTAAPRGPSLGGLLAHRPHNPRLHPERPDFYPLLKWPLRRASPLATNIVWTRLGSFRVRGLETERRSSSRKSGEQSNTICHPKGAFSHSAGTARAQRAHSANYYGDYPGNNPENHPPCGIMHNQFKTQKFKHLMLAMGPRDLNSAPYSPVHCSSHSMTSFQSSELTELPVVENSQLFAQRAHSARYAPKEANSPITTEDNPSWF